MAFLCYSAHFKHIFCLGCIRIVIQYGFSSSMDTSEWLSVLNWPSFEGAILLNKFSISLVLDWENLLFWIQLVREVFHRHTILRQIATSQQLPTNTNVNYYYLNNSRTPEHPMEQVWNIFFEVFLFLTF